MKRNLSGVIGLGLALAGAAGLGGCGGASAPGGAEQTAASEIGSDVTLPPELQGYEQITNWTFLDCSPDRLNAGERASCTGLLPADLTSEVIGNDDVRYTMRYRIAEAHGKVPQGLPVIVLYEQIVIGGPVDITVEATENDTWVGEVTGFGGATAASAVCAEAIGEVVSYEKTFP